MKTQVVVLVLGSALAHALWNAVLKRTRAPENAVLSVMVAAAVTASVIAVARGASLPPPRSAFWCLTAGLLEAGYFVTLARALTRAPLGPVYTVVRGGALVVAWPISLVFLGEHVSRATALGTLLVALGLAASGASARPRGAADVAASDESSQPGGIAWAAVCAVFVGGYHVSYKVALSTGGAAEMVSAVSLSAASAVNVVTLGAARRRDALGAAQAEPFKVAIAGALAAIGFIVFLAAMKNAGAGVVLTLRNTSILFAQALAALQGDRPRRLGILGAVFVTAGAVSLAL